MDHLPLSPTSSSIVALITNPHSTLRLISCSGLEELSSLRDLNLSSNLLVDLCPLSPLSCLELLNAADNKIEHLRGLSGLKVWEAASFSQ